MQEQKTYAQSLEDTLLGGLAVVAGIIGISAVGFVIWHIGTIIAWIGRKGYTKYFVYATLGVFASITLFYLLNMIGEYVRERFN